MTPALIFLFATLARTVLSRKAWCRVMEWGATMPGK
jgi:hypothetical protein